MESNKIDRLFREKLDQTEITPSDESWTLVKRRVKNDKHPRKMVMSVAATFSVLIIGTILIVNYTRPGASHGFIADADYPQLPVKDQLILSINNNEDEAPKADHSKGNNHKKSTSVRQPALAKTTRYQELTETKQTNTIAVCRITAPLITVNETVIPKLIDKDDFLSQPKIKIIYIASTREQNQNSKSKIIDKVLTVAQEINRSEFLADIRDTKDNLFNRN